MESYLLMEEVCPHMAPKPDGRMRLSFLGDIAVDSPHPNPGASAPFLSDADCVLANLEGAILADEQVEKHRHRTRLFNTRHVIDVLRAFNVEGVWLANNHAFDCSASLDVTIELLKEARIQCFGAGRNLEQAALPFRVDRGRIQARVFGLGWDVIGCRLATPSSEGVYPFDPAHALDLIRSLRRVDTSSYVVFVIHWNYELEAYPQPAHRQLAHRLIDEGVDAIIGAHSHVAQGAELYRGKPIVYGLGNWFFPVRQIGPLHLAFPPTSMRELALELVIDQSGSADTLFHWHRFDAIHNAVTFEATEGWSGLTLQELTPYSGMTHREYCRWFELHRHRQRLLPVYRNYNDSRRNALKDLWVRSRQRVIQSMVALRLKGG